MGLGMGNGRGLSSTNKLQEKEKQILSRASGVKQNKTKINKKPEIDKKKRNYDKLEREVRYTMLTQSGKS